MKRKQRDVNKAENSDDDDSSKIRKLDNWKENVCVRKKERSVRMKIDALYESICVNQTFEDEEKNVHRELRRVVCEYIWPKTKFVKGEGHFIKKTQDLEGR